MRADRRFRLTLIGICSLLAIGLWLAQVNPYLNPADDSGRYMVLGESLAKTGDLRLINDVRQLRDTLYVPGFPALIAFWLKVTGREPGGVVLLVKSTLLAVLLVSFPLFYALLERARMGRGAIAAAMVAYAACPAMISYANEVMSELPLLVLCLAAIVLATPRPTAGAESLATSPPERPASEFDDSTSRPVTSMHQVAPEVGGQLIQEPGEGIEPAAGEPGAPRPLRGSPARPDRSLPSLSARAIPAATLAGAILCGVLAYYVRAAGVVLLISLAVWLWRARGPGWGAATLAVTLLAVGAWQMRSSHIIATDPPNTPHDSYMRQFTLKDPDNPAAGRIQMNAKGIALRIKRCFPPNVGNIPRAVLFSMSPKGSEWQAVFFVVAVPFTVLAFLGLVIAWRRGLALVCGFCVLFWLFIALWPWLNPRFLVPLTPYILLFVFMAGERLYAAAAARLPRPVVLFTFSLGMGLLLAYYARVHLVVAVREHAPTLPGYTLGRTRDEAGFYAAAAYLKGRESEGVVMARPPYVMHLYSGHPTTQVEPATRPLVQELAYMLRNHVLFIVADRWPWSHSDNYLGPYLRDYSADWTLVWTDPGGSGVRVFRRNN